MTESEFIIMNRSDANKLNIMSSVDYSNDLAWKNTVNLLEIKCDVLEISSLGSGLKNCVLVDNVKAIVIVQGNGYLKRLLTQPFKYVVVEICVL